MTLRIPKEWILIPRKPTIDMECAVRDLDDCATPDAAHRVYNDMIAAAPIPPIIIEYLPEIISESLLAAHRKLCAYVGVCKDDKELIKIIELISDGLRAFDSDHRKRS